MPVCTPVPRLRVNHEPVAAADPRYGLFSAAIIVEDVNPHAIAGVEYEAVCDPGVVAQPIGQCGPDADPTPEKTASRGREIVEADPFAIYAAESCPPLGRTTAQDLAELRARLVSGERHTVEHAIYEGLAGARPWLRHPDTRVLADGQALDLPTAVGVLEHTLALTGHTGIIHAPRWTAPVMDHLRIAHRDGPRMRTLLGNAVAFGSGYSGAPPEGVEDDGMVWLYATPQVTIRRTGIIAPAGWEDGAFNTRTNTGFLLAERVYVVDWPCQAVAIKTNVPRVEAIPPAPVPPVPMLVVTPTSGTAPLEVTATATGFGDGDITIGFANMNLVSTNGVPVTATLPAGTYTFEALQQGPDGEWVVSNQVVVTVQAPEPPAEPTNLSVTDITAQGATVTWDWEQGTGAAATGFQVRYRTTPDGAWSAPATVDAAARSHPLAGLVAATGYEVEVTAIAAGPMVSAPVLVTFTTTA